jgi:probable biosynthetic protein (TIGR04098 family)
VEGKPLETSVAVKQVVERPNPEGAGPPAALLAALTEAIPGFSAEMASRPLAELGIDSFGLISLRARVEQVLGPVEDAVWTALATPGQFLDLGRSAVEQEAEASAGTHARRYRINMPQMAVGGLSESWLFKEIGDLHWTMIMDGLGVRSSELNDGMGDRLYATFTRLRLVSTASIASFAENEDVSMKGEIARFGAGLFFSEMAMSGHAKTLRASVMSSFSKRAEVTSNTGLLKGQPTIRPDCPIRVLEEMPAFGLGYRERRATPPSKVLFECPYEILPIHDINGAGLLYFAAYPAISDICEQRFIGQGARWAARASTVERDVCYFANCDMGDQLVYRAHARRDLGTGVEIESSISRASDGKLMAVLLTRKELIGA